VKLGLFGINTMGKTDPASMVKVAQACEASGFESVWTGEHVVLPDPQVPPSPVAPEQPMLDPAVALTWVAAHTTTLKLGTGIIILPQRNPLVLAKEMASLDHLSGGRLLLGVGVGYLEPEFRALGIPMDDRGRRTEEYIAAMRAIWSGGSYSGTYVSFDGVKANPQPVSGGALPVIMAGHTAAAYRRAVTTSQGWYGFGLDVDGTRACLDGLAKAAARYERAASLGPLEISVTPRARLDDASVAAYEEMGVHRLIPLSGGGNDAGAVVAMVEDLAKRYVR
jgi:probable F420-dependent oxidoreductase